MSRKVAIVGTAEPHWRAAPFADDTWEIWTCGGLYQNAPRSDRHFEIHAKAETCKGWGGSAEEEAAARQVYWDWIKSRGGAAYVRAPIADAPDATVYPIGEILKAFPDRYFTCSISYMIALALLEGVTELGLWGVDMALTGDPEIPASNEYARQRPSVEFFLGIAVGSGVTLHLPKGTTLLQARKLYGFEDDVDDGFLAAMDAKITELKQKVEHARQAKLHAARMEAAMETGLEIARYARRNGEY